MRDGWRDGMKRLAERGDWEALEEAWIEGLSSERIDVDTLVEAARIAARKDRKHAVMLLGLLVEEFLEQEDPVAAEPALRLALDLAPLNRDLRKQVGELIQRKFKDCPFISRVLAFSDPAGNAGTNEWWAAVEDLMDLRPGAYVNHRSWGHGIVVEMDPLAEELVIDFVDKAGHVMSWSMALKALDPLPANHLFAYAVDRRDELSAMEPIDLLGLALRSLEGEAEPKRIRAVLEPLLPKGSWTSWWSQTRAQMARDPRIQSSLGRPPRLRWVEGKDSADAARTQLEELNSMNAGDAIRLAPRVARDESLRDAVREVVRRKLPGAGKAPSLTLEGLLVLHKLGEDAAKEQAEALIRGVGDPVPMVMSIRLFEIKKQAISVLEEISEKPRAALAAELFFAAKNPRDRDSIIKCLTEEEKSQLVWTVLRHLPEQGNAYFWLVQKAEEGYPFPYPRVERLSTLLQLLPQLSALLNPVAAFLEGGRVVREAAQERGLEGASQLKKVLSDAQLPISLRKDLLDEIDRLFPELRDEGEIIFTTEQGLAKRGEELRYLVKEELPQNKRAIAEAMAHGDLKENFEYKAAKEQQERILGRISEIEKELSKARLLNPDAIDTERIGPGCLVTLRDGDGTESTLTILGPWESHPARHIYSYLAPGVHPLLGGREGENVILELGPWTGTYAVVAIRAWQ